MQRGPQGVITGTLGASRGASRSTEGALKRCSGVLKRFCGPPSVCISARVCLCARARYPPVLRGPAVFIARPATGERTLVRLPFVFDLSEIHVAAGATWKLLIASAPWDARHSHTSAIDAAGAIYVIGGRGGTDTLYNDAWMSTDGGVDRAMGGTRRLL